MFDFVANHASIDNPLIQNSLIERHLPADDPRHADYARFKDFCIAYGKSGGPSEDDIRQLSRPRPSHVLAPYVVFERGGELRAALGQRREFAADATILGEGKVWATFSRPQNDDGSEATRQVDLNFANPAVLVEVIRILLFYRRMGATLIRLDAIGYLWKKLGSSSLHEPETHLILEVIYELLAHATPETITIAEVNEPQASSFTYLGAPESPEADWVYQFTHFPLALHCLLTGDATEYGKWLPSTFAANGRQFITTLGTHDGIGMKPVRGILSDDEIDGLCAHLIDHCGGRPNHASLPGGKKIVYEVCTTPWAAINGDQDGDFQKQLDRFLAVISLSFLVRGLPAIYINGLIGADNWLPEEGLDENRSVNREVFDKQQLFASLCDLDHQHFKVLTAVKELLRQRAGHEAFSQNAPSPEVLDPAAGPSSPSDCRPRAARTSSNSSTCRTPRSGRNCRSLSQPSSVATLPDSPPRPPTISPPTRPPGLHSPKERHLAGADEHAPPRDTPHIPEITSSISSHLQGAGCTPAPAPRHTPLSHQSPPQERHLAGAG